MKKLFSILLVAAMMCAFIASASATGDPVEINMFISQPEYADAIRELIDAYKEAAPHVTINYETTQNDYPTLLKTKINAGECPDIFATTSGKEIAVYIDYSYNFAGQPADEAMEDSTRAVMMYGDEVHGFAIKSNYFGIVYNQDIFDECGITEFPTTTEELRTVCETLSAAGYTPFTTGFAEWWVYKHMFMPFLNAASEDPADLVNKFIAGEAKFADYPMLYDNFFAFIDLAVEYGDAKPLETDLAGEESALGTGKAAIMLGQGAWVEGDLDAIDPDLAIGFNGYPVSDDPAQCQVVSGSDQAMRIYKDSTVLDETMAFVNWWYTSDYGRAWFSEVAGVIPPIKDVPAPDMAIIEQGSALAAEKGAGPVSICYSTDSFHQAFGEIMQAYIGGSVTKDEACAQIEQKWVELEGASK